MGEAVQSTQMLAQPAHTDTAQGVPRPGRLRRVATRVGKLAATLFAAYYAVCLLLLVAYRFVAPPVTGVQLERRIGAWLGDGDYTVERTWMPDERIPRHVARAVVAAEDGSFWTHWGYDFKEMRNASMAVFDGQMPRGASTITQQLMKNLFGTTSQNPVRKLLDLTLAAPAEIILGKERILELYLNNVEWGPGIFGIEEAARHHYGVGVRGLSRSQAAGLAALLPNPRQRTPRNTPQYRSEILRRMSHRGW
ncbi:MAG TPA: biosynthetic peptidoglycan transglycosylase [Gemmatimonadaceae bacterium]|nr:biosynthetic peptidoglycan transglycosylase [Gemmatimonadaceae bacterium]